MNSQQIKVLKASGEYKPFSEEKVKKDFGGLLKCKNTILEKMRSNFTGWLLFNGLVRWII